MDGLFTLLSLSIVMAIASFLAGSLPLSFSLSPGQLRLISTVGMGVLVGTSLIVIIPEGVETLYSANTVGHEHGHEHGHKTRSFTSRQLNPRWTAQGIDWKRHTQNTNPFNALPGPVVPAEMTKTIVPVQGTILPQAQPADHDILQQLPGDSKHENHEKDGHHSDESAHAWVGFALISGFVMMYLIDQLPRHAASTEPSSQPYHISLQNLASLGRGIDRPPSPARDSEGGSFLESNEPRNDQPEKRSFATTTGLVIHAAADGIALGASSSAPATGLSFIIFLAIMVHKAPAAFGLTSVLLKQGLSKRAARAHLLLFSLAAPIGAIVTWILAHSLGRGLIATDSGTHWWTGILLLFSGGTFLYVAMHTMQEESSSHHHPHQESRVNRSIEGREAPPPQKPSMIDLGAAIFGMILPLFLQFGHGH